MHDSRLRKTGDAGCKLAFPCFAEGRNCSGTNRKQFGSWGMIALLVVLLAGSFTGCSSTDVEIIVPSLIEEEELSQGTTSVREQNDTEDAQGMQASEPLTESQTGVFEEPWADTYAYDSLTEAEQIWYRDINRTLGNMLEKQELSSEALKKGLDEKNIDKIFQCVLNDHPEYFYVEGYTYTRFTRLNKTVKLEFSGTYSVTEEQAQHRREEIREVVEGIVAGIAADASDYEKIKYVYEHLIRSTQYDLTAPDNQNIYSVFVNQASVCQGYAKATQYLLNRLGVKCTLVAGTVDTGEGHAWNLVVSDGDYYYVDTTWGDASYLMEESGSQVGAYLPEINYDYLCITTKQLLLTHALGGVIPMPQCQATKDNYYIREGVYFTQLDEAQLVEAFQKIVQGQREDVTLKCADNQVYEEMYGKLITEQGIFDYLTGENDTIAYAQNEKQLSMTFWMTNE